MNLKTLILVIILSILVGVMIFFFTNLTKENKLTISGNQPKSTPLLPSPSPKPSLPPINKNSDLKQEINSLTPPDFSKDFENFKTQVN